MATAPNYDNTYEENFMNNIRDMPTKNQNIVTT